MDKHPCHIQCQERITVRYVGNMTEKQKMRSGNTGWVYLTLNLYFLLVELVSTLCRVQLELLPNSPN